MNDFIPYVYTGVGFHGIYSWLNSEILEVDNDSFFGSTGQFSFKGNSFFGFDYNINQKFFIRAEVRMTYPNKYLIDFISTRIGIKL
ncbi:hypothetical protein KKB18_07165 [bacterium]|nr:hypothetical protein [bacterium]